MTTEPSATPLDVVVFADQVWDSDVPTNRQHLAARLPDHLECRVLFVESPSFFPAPSLGLGRRTDSTFHVVGDADRRRLSPSLIRLTESLYVLQPLLPAPHRHLKRVPSFLFAATRWFLSRAASRLDIDSPLVWSYSPFGSAYLPAGLMPRAYVYDCVDRYRELSYYRDYALDVAVHERKVLDDSDVVFATSQGVADGLPTSHESVHVVGNAADVDLFRTAHPEGTATPPPELADVDDVIGFYGALSGYKLDFELLQAVAESFPDATFVLLGPDDGDLPAWIETRQHVRRIGRRPQHDLPGYLAAFDVCLLPYEQSEYTAGVEPLKLFEYFAAGKPVVATDFGTLPDHDGLHVAATEEEFVELVGAALSGESGPVDATAIEERSWDAKIDRMLSILEAEGLVEGRRSQSCQQAAIDTVEEEA